MIKLNRKIIVLDFDLRKPSLHKYFSGINNDVGLSTLISGQKNLDECVQVTEEGVKVIAAGPIPPNPSELIMSESTDLLFQTLAKNYDYILIDSPPFSIVTDTAILTKKSDITLFSMMVEHTKRDDLKQIGDYVNKYEIETSGLIVNGVVLKKKEQHGYGYFNEN
jgi:capsular exopolysaccharide synthesis family protein